MDKAHRKCDNTKIEGCTQKKGKTNTKNFDRNLACHMQKLQSKNLTSNNNSNINNNKNNRAVDKAKKITNKNERTLNSGGNFCVTKCTFVLLRYLGLNSAANS